MRRLKAEDILKPGAVMEVRKIDFDDPEIKKLFAETKRRQREIESLRGFRYEGWFRPL